MSDPVPEHTRRRATPLTNMLGGVAGATTTQALFQPVDTASKNAMLGERYWKIFKHSVKNAARFEKVRRVFTGLPIALIKKIPQGAYRIPMIQTLSDEIEQHHLEKFKSLFGSDSSLYIKTVSASAAVLFEPVVMQPFDTLQMRQQSLKRPISVQEIQSLGARGLWRGSIVAGVNNVPGAVLLFSGADAANRWMGNADHSSRWKDVVAKQAGATALVLGTQPLEALRTIMQTHQISLSQAVSRTPVRELMTNGLLWRSVNSSRIGFGLYLAERAMGQTAKLFGKEVDEPERNRMPIV